MRTDSQLAFEAHLQALEDNDHVTINPSYLDAENSACTQEAHTPMNHHPKDVTPYLAELTTVDPDTGAVEPVVDYSNATMIASLISPYPHLVEANDSDNGRWNVWLPNYMTKMWREFGVTLQINVGVFQIKIDYDYT